MPCPITVPRLGWSMEEGTLSEWLKAPGDFVHAGDMIFVLEGEKAANEIESLDSGTLCIPADAPRPGTTVKVGETIGFLLAEGELAPTSVRSPAPALGMDLKQAVTPDLTGQVLRADVQGDDRRSSSLMTRQAIATPRAKRRAHELGIDWTRLIGTGRAGRIRERDVEGAVGEVAGAVGSGQSAVGEVEGGVGSGQSAVGENSSPFPTAHSPLPISDSPLPPPPVSKLRQVIAQRMMAGVHEAAPVTLTTKVNAEALVAFREQLKASAADGVVPSYNDILIQCVAHTLRELPELNACWHRDGIHNDNVIHIATAVDTPDGLLAPVVRDADRLTLREIAEQTRQLIAQARSGRLSQQQLVGGTFTVSNLGSFGIDAFTPILNLPQAGILGIGRIVDEPVVRNGQVVAGKTITLSLTFDHRVIDGAPAARWLQRLGERVQMDKVGIRLNSFGDSQERWAEI